LRFLEAGGLLIERGGVESEFPTGNAGGKPDDDAVDVMDDVGNEDERNEDDDADEENENNADAKGEDDDDADDDAVESRWLASIDDRN
jgi:Ran GTPase-activating protein (RanGAP) involved in mRNA processing and transport